MTTNESHHAVKKSITNICATLTLTLLLLVSFKTEAGNSWSSKKSFGGGKRASAAGFMIGDKAYIGIGTTNGSSGSKDFWEWDVSTNTWTQKADFGGGVRVAAVGFSIGSKGFIGTGSTSTNAYYSQNDFWEYDPSANTWTQKTKYPGGITMFGVGFSIGANGYIGTGQYFNGGSIYYSGFYQYDTSADSWTQKAAFAGGSRSDAVGFSIGSKGYIGTGADAYGTKTDFWEYNPSSDKWTQKASFPGASREDAVGFSIGSKGYLGVGNNGYYFNPYSDMYEYSPSANTWTSKTSYGIALSSAVGFSSCTHGYIGTGADGATSFYSDFMEYTPSVPLEAVIAANKTELCPGGSVNFSDSSTNGPTSWNWTFKGGSPGTSTDQNPSNIVFKNRGSYTVTLIASNTMCSSTASLTITVNPLPTITTNPASPTVCAGSSVSISANGASSYSWLPGTGLSSTTNGTVTANPSYTTNYTVTGTSLVGCVNTGTVTITVNQKPTVTINPTSKTICSGDVVPLSASGASTYSWSPSTGLNSTKGTSVNATPLNTITYTVTGTDGNGCKNTATIPITVNALPIADAGHDVTICGGSTNLLAAGGISYSWSPPTGLSCTNCPDPVASPSATTKYMVTVTGGNGCSKTASVTVNISTSITAHAGSDSSICNGKSTMLNASGGTGYSWYPATGLTNPKSYNPIASPDTTTTYTVIVTSGTCTPDSDRVTITVNPLPSTPTITANGTTLKSSSPTGNQWYMNGAPLSGETSQYYTVLHNGFYSVCVSNSNGCTSCSQDTSTAGINEDLFDNSTSIFPNPSRGQLTLYIPNSQQKTEITIYNLLGTMIYSSIVSELKTEINLASQPKGTYFIEVISESGIFNKKVVIE